MPSYDELFDKLLDSDRHYQLYTDKLSTACRMLAVSEGAFFWFFQQKLGFTNLILIGLFLVAAFFVTDTFQYRYGMLDYENNGDKLRKILLENKEVAGDIKFNIDELPDPRNRLERFFKHKFRILIVCSIILAVVFICIGFGLLGYVIKP